MGAMDRRGVADRREYRRIAGVRRQRLASQLPSKIRFSRGPCSRASGAMDQARGTRTGRVACSEKGFRGKCAARPGIVSWRCQAHNALNDRGLCVLVDAVVGFYVLEQSKYALTGGASWLDERCGKERGAPPVFPRDFCVLHRELFCGMARETIWFSACDCADVPGI